MDLSLIRALRAESFKYISFIGSGGKTSAIFKLAVEYQRPVIVSNTTHLGEWQARYANRHFTIANPSQLKLNDEFTGIQLITGELEDGRFKPLDPVALLQLKDYCKDRSIPLLIEADGSRQKPLKGWAEHEPPIPGFSDLVVYVAGLSALGKPLNDEYVHRSEVFSRLSQSKIGESITLQMLVRSINNPDGPLKNIPSTAERAILLNQADTSELQAAAKSVAPKLLNHFHPVVTASLKNNQVYAVHGTIGGIILAAGEASRYGQPKQILHWKGQPFVRKIAQTALSAGLLPVTVVTGAYSEQVKSALDGLDVELVHNDHWEDGQGSSIRVGMSALQGRCDGVIFLLVDQPQISPAIIHALREKHSTGLDAIVAPMVLDRRANPVLFDKVTFSDLLQVEGDMGGRAIFHKHRVEYLPWHDDSLLLDVDTPGQYQRLISNEDL